MAEPVITDSIWRQQPKSDLAHQYTNATQNTPHKTTQTPHNTPRKTSPGEGLQSLIALFTARRPRAVI